MIVMYVSGLKKLLEDQKKTLQDMSRDCDMSMTSVYSLVKNPDALGNCKFSTVLKIKDYLGYDTIDELIEDIRFFSSHEDTDEKDTKLEKILIKAYTEGQISFTDAREICSLAKMKTKFNRNGSSERVQLLKEALKVLKAERILKKNNIKSLQFKGEDVI